LVVAGALAGEDRVGWRRRARAVCRGAVTTHVLIVIGRGHRRQLKPPSRIRASVARLMLPPETITAILLEPDAPDSAAAVASAPAPSAITRNRSASVPPAPAVSPVVPHSA